MVDVNLRHQPALPTSRGRTSPLLNVLVSRVSPRRQSPKLVVNRLSVVAESEIEVKKQKLIQATSNNEVVCLTQKELIPLELFQGKLILPPPPELDISAIHKTVDEDVVILPPPQYPHLNGCSWTHTSLFLQMAGIKVKVMPPDTPILKTSEERPRTSSTQNTPACIGGCIIS